MSSACSLAVGRWPRSPRLLVNLLELCRRSDPISVHIKPSNPKRTRASCPSSQHAWRATRLQPYYFSARQAIETIALLFWISYRRGTADSFLSFRRSIQMLSPSMTSESLSSPSRILKIPMLGLLPRVSVRTWLTILNSAVFPDS
jgi:hypothetical protein